MKILKKKKQKIANTSGKRPCMSETAAKFDMSTILPLPTTHRERQSAREGTGEMGSVRGSVTGTAEFMVHEPSTSPHQQGRA